jgi:alpha-1,2-mannosyltransferase
VTSLPDAGAVNPPTSQLVRFAYLSGVLVLVALALLSIVTFLEGLNTGSVGFDFRGAYLPAAHDVLDGESPYPPLEGPELASHNAYVYPPLLAYAVTPFTIFSVSVAAVLAVIGVAALLVATLVVLGVRDVRCYGAAFLWAPTMNVLHMGSSSALLAFAAALAWRYRATVWPLAATLGLGIAVKIILWPLLVWAVATRRLRPALLAVLVGGGVALALWSLVGFDGLGRYPAMLRRLADLEAHESYSLVGALTSIGLGDGFARTVAVAVGVALLVGCVVVARRGDDLRSFTLALAASLALTPIVWLHYLVLLLVPLAIARPRFSAIWLMPILLWLTPLNGNGELVQPFLPTFVAASVIAYAMLGAELERTAIASASPGAESR